MRFWAAVAAAIVLTGGAPSRAQDLVRSKQGEKCAAFLGKSWRAIGYSDDQIDDALKDLAPGTECNSVAAAVYTRVAEQLRKATPRVVAGKVPPRAVQPPDTETDGGQGSPAQTAAVPSVRPTGQSGGSVAFAGTEDGPRLVGVLSANPIALASEDTKTLSWASRLADVSIVLPIDTRSKDATETRNIDFVGVRVRINAGAFWSGGDAYDAALAAYSKLYDESANFIRAIEQLLANAPDVEKCAGAIEAIDEEKIEADCGGKLEFDRQRELESKARRKLANARSEADRSYFGLDLRADFGDVLFEPDMEVDGQYWVASAAAGKRLGRSHRSMSVRGRAGIAYASVGDETTYSFDFGAAVEVSVGDDEVKRTRASVGIEGRQKSGDDDSGLADTDFVLLQLGVTTPLADAKNISIGITIPVDGDRGTMFSLSGDWSALLSDVVKE